MKTHEQRLEEKREWYRNNPEKVKEIARKSREKHKEQRAKDTKTWIEKNKEHSTQYHKDYNKAWYEKNKEKRKAQLKEYAQTHKEGAVKRVQKYTAKNKEKVYGYGKQYNQTLQGRYRILLTRAKKWGAPYILLADFTELSSQPCVYCGDDGRVGIDRVDNSIGYTRENSAPACTLCNFMKKALTAQDFLNHITKIYKHNEDTNLNPLQQTNQAQDRTIVA